MAFIYNYIDKKLEGEARPIVNITKYISFFAYRPYLNPKNPTETCNSIVMFNLGKKYEEKFDYYIQNRITHELVHNFIIDADLNEEWDDLLGFFDRTRFKYMENFKDYELDRLRTVLEIIKEKDISIHKVAKLNSKKLAKVAITDYKYFNFKNDKKKGFIKSKTAIFIMSFLIVLVYYFIQRLFN